MSYRHGVIIEKIGILVVVLAALAVIAALSFVIVSVLMKVLYVSGLCL